MSSASSGKWGLFQGPKSDSQVPRHSARSPLSGLEAMSEASKEPHWERMSMCFLNQKGGLSLAKATQASKQAPVNGEIEAAKRSHSSKMRTIIALVPTRKKGGRAFETTDVLIRTFHLRDDEEGRSGCLQSPQKLIKACCNREGAHSCIPTPLMGPPRDFQKARGLLLQGPMGKAATDALCGHPIPSMPR